MCIFSIWVESRGFQADDESSKLLMCRRHLSYRKKQRSFWLYRESWKQIYSFLAHIFVYFMQTRRERVEGVARVNIPLLQPYLRWISLIPTDRFFHHICSRSDIPNVIYSCSYLDAVQIASATCKPCWINERQAGGDDANQFARFLGVAMQITR